MACGCGPAGAALMRIRQSLTEGELMSMELQEGQTLMEYTGGKAGITSVQSRTKRLDGRLVRYTYGGDQRLIAVWNEDVAFLEGLGFRRATDAAESPPETRPARKATTRPAAAPEPVQAATEADVTFTPAPALVEATAAEDAPVADAAEVEVAFDQGALQRAAESKAQQHKQRGRPRKQG